LRGLKKALRNLTLARTHSKQSLLSKSYKGQGWISSPEGKARAGKSASQEQIQTVVTLVLEQPCKELGEDQAYPNTATSEETFPILIRPPVSQQSPREAEATEDWVSTTGQGNTMADGAFTNGGKSQDEWGSTSAGHNMADVDTNDDTFFPLTKDCHHYTRRADVDWDIQKYVLVLENYLQF